PIVAFYRGALGPGEEEQKRDLGVALVRGVVLRRLRPEQVTGRATVLLEQAVRRAPQDIEAQQSLGAPYPLLGRRPGAQARFQKGLSLAPTAHRALGRLMDLAAGERRYSEAADYARRLVAANPHVAGNRLALARLLSQADRWPEARAEAQEAV